MDGPGGEAALFERLKGTAAVVILDNCEHVLDAAAALAVRLLDAAPGLRILCTSQVPLDVDGEAVFELAPLAARPTPSSCSPAGPRHNAAARAPSADDDAVLDLCRSLDGLPLAIELAAARTKTLSIEEITRRLDDRFTVLSDPTSRRPERRRSLRSTIRWSYDLLFPDDQRGLWALATFAGGAPLPAVEFVLEALDVPAAAAIDVVGRLASRSLVIVDDERDCRSACTGSLPAAGQHPGVRARGDDRRRADRARPRRARRLVRRGGRVLHRRVCAAVAKPNTWPSPAPSAPTSTPHWPGAPTHDPLLALDIVNGFGWAWVVLGDSRGAQRILAALDAAGDAAPPRTGPRPPARGVDRSVDRSPRPRPRPRRRGRRAGRRRSTTSTCRLAAATTSPTSCRTTASSGTALELTDRSRALYDGLDRPWDQAANGLFAARAAISAGDEERSVEAADRVAALAGRSSTTRGCDVRGDAMLGELARFQHRFDDAVVHIGRAAETSRRLGFLQTEAYQLVQPRTGPVPGRRLRHRRGHPGARRSTRPRPPATCGWRRSPGSTSAASCGPSGDARRRAAALEAADRLAPRRRRRRTGRTRRVPAGRHGRRRRRRRLPRSASSRSSTRPGATATPMSRSSPSTHSPASPPTTATSTRRTSSVRGGRPAHGGRLPLHHRPRPDRRPVGQTGRSREPNPASVPDSNPLD